MRGIRAHFRSPVPAALAFGVGAGDRFNGQFLAGLPGLHLGP